MGEHEQVYQINGECQQCGRMYCDNGEQCALAIALRTERNIADQSEEIAQLRAALAESQRRESVLREAVTYADSVFENPPGYPSPHCAVMRKALAETQPGEGT